MSERCVLCGEPSPFNGTRLANAADNGWICIDNHACAERVKAKEAAAPAPALRQGEERREERGEEDAPGCILCGNTQADLLQSQPQGLVCRNAGDCSERQAPAPAEAPDPSVITVDGQPAVERLDYFGMTERLRETRQARDEAQRNVVQAVAYLQALGELLDPVKAEGELWTDTLSRLIQERDEAQARAKSLEGGLERARQERNAAGVRAREETGAEIEKLRRERDEAQKKLAAFQMRELTAPMEPIACEKCGAPTFWGAGGRCVDDHACEERQQKLRAHPSTSAPDGEPCGECERLEQECARLRRTMSQAVTAYDYREEAQQELEIAMGEFEGREGIWKRMLETLQSESRIPAAEVAEK